MNSLKKICKEMQNHCERDQEGQEEKTEKVASAPCGLNPQEPLIPFHVHPKVNFHCVIAILVSFCLLQSRAIWSSNGFQNQQQVLEEDVINYEIVSGGQ